MGEKQNEWHRKLYWESREQGLCGHCGKRWAEAGRSMCRTCRIAHQKTENRPGAREALRAYKKAKREERRENGLCLECGKVLKEDERGVYMRCLACRKKRRESTNMRRLRMRIHGIKRKN